MWTNPSIWIQAAPNLNFIVAIYKIGNLNRHVAAAVLSTNIQTEFLFKKNHVFSKRVVQQKISSDEKSEIDQSSD